MQPVPTATGKVAIVGDRFEINGRGMPLNELLNVEVGQGEIFVRSFFIIFACVAAPVLAMVFFTVIKQSEPRMTLGLAAAVMPFFGILVSVLWKKPWAVIGEFPTQYRVLYQTRDRNEAESLVSTLRGAIRH